MPVPPQDDDPLRTRLRDPAFARAYESWLELMIERGSRVAPRHRPRTRPAPGRESERRAS